MTNPTDFWPVWSIKKILGSSGKLNIILVFNNFYNVIAIN